MFVFFMSTKSKGTNLQISSQVCSLFYKHILFNFFL